MQFLWDQYSFPELIPKDIGRQLDYFQVASKFPPGANRFGFRTVARDAVTGVRAIPGVPGQGHGKEGEDLGW